MTTTPDIRRVKNKIKKSENLTFDKFFDFF